MHELTPSMAYEHHCFTQCLSIEKMSSVSHSIVSDSLQPHGLQPTRLLCPWDSPGKNTGVGCYSLLQGIFLTQGSNPGLPHCRQILYHLSHLGSPWICVHPILFLFLMLRPYANILVNCFHDTDVKSAGIWSLYEQCCVMSIQSIGSTQCSALCILLTISVFIQVKRPFLLKEKDSSGVQDSLRQSVRQGRDQVEEETPWKRREGKEGCCRHEAKCLWAIFPFLIPGNFTEWTSLSSSYGRGRASERLGKLFRSGYLREHWSP